MNHRPLTIALANSGRKWIGEIAHVAMLYTQLDCLGHRPWIICRRGYALEAHAREAGMRFLALEFNSHFHPWQDARDLQRWLRWVAEERPDIIHCHRGKDHWLGCAVAWRCRCPLVRTRHVVTPVRQRWLNRWLYLRATDAVICVSQAARNTFGPWKEELSKCQTILSAVDADRFHPQARSEAWRRSLLADPAGSPPPTGTAEPLWFGLIGRFQRIKGQRIFLEAAARVASQCPEARFLLAGAGGEIRQAILQERAAELGIGDRVLVLGLLSNLPEVLASLDVGVIASLGSEGSSRIALEMMASELPLVATRVGGIPDLTEPCNSARLVPPGDPVAMAEAMLAWARQPLARHQCGQSARQHVLQAHHPKAWAESILQVYRSVCRPDST